MKSWKLSLVLSTLAVAGCGAATPPPADSGSPDVGTPADASAPADAATTSCTYPAGPYGSDEGRLFRPFTLPGCDGSTTFNFADESFCSSSLTVVIASAGWCVPCQMEAPQIETEIVQRYADRGVRVVTIMFQNPDYSPPTAAFCQTWQSRYGQTNTGVIDPMGLTSIYFPNMAYPANIIIDASGRIRYRQYGVSDGLQTLRDQIDAILTEEGR